MGQLNEWTNLAQSFSFPEIMGLAISYHFQLDHTSISEAREKILALHQYAFTLPFAEVYELVELVDSDCCFQSPDPLCTLKVCALTPEDLTYNLLHNAEHTNCCYLIGFNTLPGNGGASAAFGLSTQTIDQKNQQWMWNGFCKTQYANHPEYGGIENFLRCHLLVIKMLDLAQQLGIVSQVVDPSGYWEHRDIDALIQTITDETVMIAAVMGSLKDIFQDQGYQASAPSQDSPNFEYLEAQGQEKLNIFDNS